MEPRNPLEPIRPPLVDPHPRPSPFTPPEHYVTPREQEVARILREILERLMIIEKRLTVIEDHLKVKRGSPIV